ncbi:MAG: CBS domain-containing protein [Candidatus Heimdallarchaeaceae archaeon]
MSENTSIISEFLSIKSDTPLAKAIELFRKDVREILVFNEEDTFLGYLSKRFLTRQSKLNPEAKVSSLIIRVPTVRKNDSFHKIAQALLSAKVYSIPVEEKGKIIGVIKDIDLIRAAIDNFEGKQVKELMTQNPICITPDATIAKLIATSRTYNVSRLPVVNENNELVGIVSPHDLANLVITSSSEQTLGDRTAEKYDLLKVEVKDIMTEEVVTIKADDMVIDAINSLYETNHKAFVVIDEKNHPIGIITTRDLLETVSRPPATKGYYVRVLGDVDEEDYNQVVDMGIELIKKYAEIIGTSGQLFIHAKVIPKKKFRGFSLYQVRVRIATDKGNLYVSRADGYGLFAALAVALDRIEREIVSEREQELQQRRTTKFILEEELEEI